MSKVKKLQKLVQGSVNTMRNEGPLSFYRKSKKYLIDKARRSFFPELYLTRTRKKPYFYKDVLIVYPGDNVFEWYRARQIEESLIANNVSAFKKSVADLRPSDHRYATTIVLINIEHSPIVGKFIERAKHNNKELIYERLQITSAKRAPGLIEKVESLCDYQLSTSEGDGAHYLPLKKIQPFMKYRVHLKETFKVGIVENFYSYKEEDLIDTTYYLREFSHTLPEYWHMDGLLISRERYDSLSDIERAMLDQMYGELLEVCDGSPDIKSYIEKIKKRYLELDDPYKPSSMDRDQRLEGFFKERLKNSVALLLPSGRISGGVMVAITHLEKLRKLGMKTTAFNMEDKSNTINVSGALFEMVPTYNQFVDASFTKAIGTFWSTVDTIEHSFKTEQIYYLVQGLEPDFYPNSEIGRAKATSTYRRERINYITISEWCVGWLKDRYGVDAFLVRNGIDMEKYRSEPKDFSGKIKVLIEGSCEDEYKNVDMSFKIANRLDPEKFQITYMSYGDQVKDWYRYDRVLFRVPYEEAQKLYKENHILIKTSLLESFSYPPLEMMAASGIPFLIQNDGNRGFVKHEENAMLFQNGDVEGALQMIDRVVSDKELREKLIENGLKTAKDYDWKGSLGKIATAYGVISR